MTLYDQFLNTLKEVYNLYPDEPFSPSRHIFDYDYRFHKLICTLFELDFSKLNQINNIDLLINYISNGEISNRNSNFKVSIYFNINSINIFFNLFSISIVQGKILNEIPCIFSSKKFHVEDFLSGTAYESVYQEKLKRLNELLPYGTTYKSFWDVVNFNLKDNITSTICDNNVIYHTVDEFSLLLPELKADESENNSVTSLPRYVFKPTNYKVHDVFKYLINTVHLNKFNEIFSMFVFKEQLDDPDFYSKSFDISITHLNPRNKFKDKHLLYTINFTHNPEFNGYQILHISTDADFLIFEGGNPRNINESFFIKGIDAIHHYLKNSLIEKIAKALDIPSDEINNTSVEVYKMMRF